MICWFFFFLMIRRPPRSTLDRSSAASDVYKRQGLAARAARASAECVACTPRRSVELEHAIELGHQQHVARLAAHAAQLHAHRVAADPLAQQQQHAERRAVDVVDAAEVDDPRARVAPEQLLELLDHPEVESPGDLDGDGVDLIGDLHHGNLTAAAPGDRTSRSASCATSPLRHAVRTASSFSVIDCSSWFSAASNCSASSAASTSVWMRARISSEVCLLY